MNHENKSIQREGSLDAPTRHPIDWQNPDFYDMEKIESELERVFDICHGCRRCFNLCNSFPVLFDLLDESETGELDGVDKGDYKKVVDECTLCDMCFMTKCPYVPPHEFNLDFPHLMLRYRAAKLQLKSVDKISKRLTRVEKMRTLGTKIPVIANWSSKRDNKIPRSLLSRYLDVHPDAQLPVFANTTAIKKSLTDVDLPQNEPETAKRGKKVILYATCYGNYHQTEIVEAAHKVLVHNGVETKVLYPQCCGMPLLEQGDISKVAQAANRVAAQLILWIDEGYEIAIPLPSCALMLKFEWPLICTDNKDVKRLSENSYDICEYLISHDKQYGLEEDRKALDGNVTLHMACHARAQNMGQKAAELLRLIPELKVDVVERCSGHGGSWGVSNQNFKTAMKISKPVVRQINKSANKYLTSECPLAGLHLYQSVTQSDTEKASAIVPVAHPIVLLARSYGLI